MRLKTMRFATDGILFTAMVLATSASAQNTPAPTATARKVIAAAKLPTVTDAPLHFRVLSVTISPGEKSSVSGAGGVLYQVSGSTEVSRAGEAKVIDAGDGFYIAAGTTAELKAGSGAPSTFLYFLLSPAANLDRAAATAPSARANTAKA